MSALDAIRSMLQALTESNADIRDRTVASRVYVEERLDKMEAAIATLSASVSTLTTAVSAASTALPAAKRPRLAAAESDSGTSSSNGDDLSEEDEDAAAGAGSSSDGAVGLKRGRRQVASAGAAALPGAARIGDAASSRTPAASAANSAAAAAGDKPYSRAAARHSSGVMTADPGAAAAAATAVAAASFDGRGPAPTNDEVSDTLIVIVCNAEGAKTNFRCKPSTRIGAILSTYVEKLGIGFAASYDAIYEGNCCNACDTLAQRRIENGDVITVMPKQAGGMMHETSGRWCLDALV